MSQGAFFRSSPRGAPRDGHVAGTPLRGPSARPWIPSISAFTRVRSPSKTGVNALNDALCAGTTVIRADQPAQDEGGSNPQKLARVAAGDGGDGRGVEAVRGRDVADWIVVGHVEGIIRSHDDVVDAVEAHQ